MVYVVSVRTTYQLWQHSALLSFFFFFFCCCCCFSFQHKSPDYSAVYIVFKTDEGTGKEGHGLTFTLGRGNELGTQPIQ